MSRLVLCPSCDRHVKPSETRCPHCGHSSGALSFAAIALGAGLAIAGCDRPVAAVYGPPPMDPTVRVPTAEPSATTTEAPATSSAPTTSAPTTTSAPATTSAPSTSASTTKSIGTATKPMQEPAPVPMPAYGPAPVRPKDRL
ncbi:MAG: hypothetical protein U0441_29055 [Polyangiaceae bacterium]